MSGYHMTKDKTLYADGNLAKHFIYKIANKNISIPYRTVQDLSLARRLSLLIICPT